MRRTAAAAAADGRSMARAGRGRDQEMPWDPRRPGRQRMSREKSWAGRGWGRKECGGWSTGALMCLAGRKRDSC